MPVDFFNPSCLTIITTKKVGISDANSDNDSPAFVMINKEAEWDFVIHNPNEKRIEYRAVDYCIDIFRTSNYDVKDEYSDPTTFSSDSVGNTLIKRCEGFLFRENEFVVFFEIKTGLAKGWFTDASRKFEETILSFKEHHLDKVDLVRNPIISNTAKPKVPQNYAFQNKILKDKIGLSIKIELSTVYHVV